MKKFENIDRRKRRRMQYSSFDVELLDKVCDYGELRNISQNQALRKIIENSMPFMGYLKYNICGQLPYSVRLKIVDYISVISSRFMITANFGKQSSFIFSYAKRKRIKLSDYVRLMFGYFKQDRSRKVYLVFGYLVFRLGENTTSIKYLPQRQLRQIYVLDGYISDYDGIPLHLSSLCMNKIAIMKSQFTKLLKSLKNLRKFAVKNITGLNDLDIIKIVRKVEVLRIMQCSLDSVHCESLLKSDKIRVLNLCENIKITSWGLSSLLQNFSVRVLSLDDSSVCDKCVDYILKNKYLHQVEVNGTSISVYGVIKLLTHPSIRWIEAGNTQCDVELENSEIQKIMCSENHEIANFNPIQNCLSLEKLLMDLSKLPVSFYSILVERCKKLSFLSLCNCCLTDGHVNEILKLESLDSLFLSFNPKLTKMTIRKLGNHRTLKQLEYCQPQLQNTDAVLLFLSDSIRTLWIEGRYLSNNCLSVLGKNKVLQSLHITGENKIDSFGRKYVTDACSNITEFKYTVCRGDANQRIRETRVWYRP